MSQSTVCCHRVKLTAEEGVGLPSKELPSNCQSVLSTAKELYEGTAPSPPPVCYSAVFSSLQKRYRKQQGAQNSLEIWTSPFALLLKHSSSNKLAFQSDSKMYWPNSSRLLQVTCQCMDSYVSSTRHDHSEVQTFPTQFCARHPRQRSRKMCLQSIVPVSGKNTTWGPDLSWERSAFPVLRRL